MVIFAKQPDLHTIAVFLFSPEEPIRLFTVLYTKDHT